MTEIKMTEIKKPAVKADCSAYGKAEAEKALAFHKTFEEYSVTPLAELSALAQHLGVKGFYVKDESYRFGLNAFKVLGGSYCLGNCIKEKEAEAAAKGLGPIGQQTFVTATDGNHGRGVAWTATKLGHKSVVYMPAGSALERLNNIKAAGADAAITDMNYDDAVRFANAQAEKNGWIMVQDTAWEGYERLPHWIMQGYTTMALEAVCQLGNVKPTHVFLQAGVGAMSGAVTGFLADYYKDCKPVITIVEPDKADCIFRTAEAGDGKLHFVGGAMSTIMAGLACGEPCTLGWKQIESFADYAVSMPDKIAARGMRVLGNPLDGDPKVVSGESGAAGAGFAVSVLSDSGLADMKKRLGLDENSVILCFSTEGATDRENYRRIVWDGAYTNNPDLR